MPKLFSGGMFDNLVNEDLVQAASVPTAELFASLIKIVNSRVIGITAGLALQRQSKDGS